LPWRFSLKKALSLTLYIVGILLLIAAAKIPFLYSSSATPGAIILAIAGSIVFAVAWIDATFQDHAIGLLGLVRPADPLLSRLAADLYSVGSHPNKLADLAAKNM